MYIYIYRWFWTSLTSYFDVTTKRSIWVWYLFGQGLGVIGLSIFLVIPSSFSTYNTTNSTVVQWTIFYRCRTMYTYMYTTMYIMYIMYIIYIYIIYPNVPNVPSRSVHLVHFALSISRRVTLALGAWARSPCGCVPSSCVTCWIGPSRRMSLAMIPTPRWRSSPSYVTLIGAPGAAW
jgi:hypothetical protein